MPNTPALYNRWD